MKRIAIAIILALCLLLIPTANVMAAGVAVVDKTEEDGDWTGDTWEVNIYPGETKSTTIKLYNSSSSSLRVEVSITPDLACSGNLTFEHRSSFTMSGKSHADVTLTARASGSATPGNYTAKLEIKSKVPSPPSNGNGGNGDLRLPTISDIELCLEGVTETTADICWTTDERSTSQVEYWSNPSILSPLDGTRVIDHHVELTGLIPGTTYYYKVMSENAAGNLATSSKHTFTTLETPVASFSTINLLIYPSEVDTGENVTISVLVTNTGNAPGSYEAVLKINGAVETTKDVTLNASIIEEIFFTVVKDVAGEYLVEVDGLEGSFIVKGKSVPLVTPTFPIWAIIGIVVAAGLIVLFLVRRKRATKH